MASQFKVTYGGWYQRTTIHLSEIYDLLALGKSSLKLDPDKLTAYHQALDLKDVSRVQGYLEFVRAETASGIVIKYYEDGLYVLEAAADGSIAEAKKQLEDYFEQCFNPAISYIFSLGAPTPKVLANIKTTHPTVITVSQDQPETFQVEPQEFGEVYSELYSEKKDIAVFKTPRYIFVVAKPGLEKMSEELVEMQIFFREFKDQLEKYLNIHRNLWEEITTIKERKKLRGTEVEAIRSELDSYQKTISLISNRLNQMGSYIRTRSSISKGLELEEHLRSLFQFKFEVLTDTWDYIKEIWKMTTDYLNSAIQRIVEIKNQGTSRGIQSLQLITSIGVVSGIMGYLSKNEPPKFTAFGSVYFIAIILITWLVNWTIIKIYSRKKYNLQFSEAKKDL